MKDFTMYVRRDKTSVELSVHIPYVNDDNATFPFSFDCGYEWVAKLLERSLRDALASTVKGIREEEYYAGLKDARGKKENRRDFFSGALKIQGKN